MSGTLWAMATTFGWGILHFISAIFMGVAVLKLSPVTAGICAWAGYTAIGAAMLLVGDPARRWLEKKFRISPQPDPKKVFWRAWGRFGMPGLALLAPVTAGPYLAALIALALGEKPLRVILWIAAGAIPWTVLFAVLAGTGISLFGK